MSSPPRVKPKKWSMEGADGAGRIGQAERPATLPPGAFVGITRIADLAWWQRWLNFLITVFLVLPPMRRNPDLLYWEIYGNRDKSGITMTVWTSGRAMMKWRDGRSHGYAMRRLGWIVYGGSAKSWFLSFKTDRVPSSEVADDLAKRFGKMLTKDGVARDARPAEARAAFEALQAESATPA